MLLFIVATIAGIAALAMFGGSVGSFAGNKRAAGWGYLLAMVAILVAFTQFGVATGYWDLPSWVPFSTATLGRPQPSSWLQKSGGSPAGPLTPEALKDDLEAKVKELDVKRTALAKLLTDLKKEKGEVIDWLTTNKVSSEVGFKNNPLAEQKGKRLVELVQRIDAADRKVLEIDKTLDHGRTVLRDLDRQLALKEAGLSEQDLAEVTTAIRFVDEKLKSDNDTQPATPLEVDAVLKKELGGKS